MSNSFGYTVPGWVRPTEGHDLSASGVTIPAAGLYVIDQTALDAVLSAFQGVALEFGPQGGSACRLSALRASKATARAREYVALTESTFVTGKTTSGAATGTCRTPQMVTLSGTDVRLVYTNTGNSGTATSPNNNDLDGTTPITIGAGIEYGGTTIPVTFEGAFQVTIQPGGHVMSDPLGIDVVAGQMLYVRTYISASAAFFYNRYSGTAGTGQGGWVATTDNSHNTTSIPDVANTPLYGPAAIVGHPADTTNPVVVISGDSIAHGYYDSTGAIAFQGVNYTNYGIAGGGYIARALRTAGIPYVSITESGDVVNTFITQVGHFRRARFCSFGTDVICEYGRNDIGSRTAAQVEADLLTAWNMFVNRGCRVWQTTITPKTTSTDFWATTAGQTPDAVSEPVRIALNTWIRNGAPIMNGAPVAPGTSGALLAGQTGHPLQGYFEVADYVESAHNSGLWKPAQNLRTVADGVTTAGGSTLTSATAAFTTADEGRILTIAGAGTSGAVWQGRIAKRNSATSVTLDASTPTAVSAASVTLGDFMTQDGLHPSPWGAIQASAGLTG